MKAQRICAGCGVRQQCLDFAMQNGEVHGVWGGTTPEERIRARRALLRRARRAQRGAAWQEAQAS
jgi:WhiB family redox-sensing transcriptional regulator